MSKFNIGDHVQTKPLVAMPVDGIITGIMLNGAYKIKTSNNRQFYCFESDIELVVRIYLPPGAGQPSYTSISDGIDYDRLKKCAADNLALLSGKKNDSSKCDCGGLKTHGSLESMFHSTWCSSQKNDHS